MERLNAYSPIGKVNQYGQAHVLTGRTNGRGVVVPGGGPGDEEGGFERGERRPGMEAVGWCS